MRLFKKRFFIPYAEYERVLEQAEKDSSLAAALVEECQRLQRDNDELSDENARLISDNEGAAARIAAANTSMNFYMQNVKEAEGVIQEVFEALTDDKSAVSCNNYAVEIINNYWHSGDEKYWRSGEDKDDD